MKYTKKEYRKKIDELRPVAYDLMANKTPEDALEMASMMDPVDAYIMGRIIGGVLQAEADAKEFMRVIPGLVVKIEKAERGQVHNVNVNGNFNFN